MLRRTLLASLLMVCVATAAVSQTPAWQPDGVRVCHPPCDPETTPWVLPDGEGGIYVAWTDGRELRDPSTNLSEDVYLQRLTSSGQIHAGWPPEGLPVCREVNIQILSDLAPDGLGGVFVVWQDFRRSNPPTSTSQSDITAQRILPDGSIAPGWPVNGAPATLDPKGQSNPTIAPDGEGGAFVVWRDRRNLAVSGDDLYAQHLTASGTPAPGWPADGLPLCTAPGDQINIPSVVADGHGGMLFGWGDCRTIPCPTYGTRLLPDGSLAPGWNPDGNLLAAAPHQFWGMVVRESTFYLASAGYVPSGDIVSIEVQRFALDGTTAPGWPQAGVSVCCPELENRQNVLARDDGAGGVLLSWYVNGPVGQDVLAARVLPDATLAAGWPFGGIVVNDTQQSNNSTQDIVSDGNGGAYVTWEWHDFSVARTFARLQHLTHLGQVAEGWPPYGIVLSELNHQQKPRLASDGAGGVIAVWQEQCCGRAGMWAQHFPLDGIVSTLPAVVSAEAEDGLVTVVWYAKGAGELGAAVERRQPHSDWQYLGEPTGDGPDGLRYEDRSVVPGERYAYRLRYPDAGGFSYSAEAWVEVPLGLSFALEGLRPNPATGAPAFAFSLPDDKAAVLEVLDVAGRRLLYRQVGSLGPGQHVLRLEEASVWRPGIYWIRLTREGETRTARGVLLAP